MGAMSLQALQAQDNEALKAIHNEKSGEEKDIQESIQLPSWATREVQTVSAEVCCVCCKCNCHQPAPPTKHQPATPTKQEVGVQADRTLCVSYSKKSPPKSRSEPTFFPYQQSAVVGSEERSSMEHKPVEAGQHKSEDAPQVVEDRVERDKEEVRSEPKQEVGRNASKQEAGSNEGSSEPKQEVENTQETIVQQSNDSKQEATSLEKKQEEGSHEGEESGECVDGRSSELESSEVFHDHVVESKTPPLPAVILQEPPPPAPKPQTAPPPAPTPQVTPPPAHTPEVAPPSKQCLPVPSRASPPPLPEASPSPVPEPYPSSKEDDYATVADALALAEGERVVVVKRPSLSSQCAALPSHFKVLGNDDYCEVIFPHTDDETPLVQAGEGGLKRVRTLPRQGRQEKEEVVKLKERSFSLRGKPPYPKGRRPVDILPAPPPSAAVESLVERNPHHEGTTEEVAMATEIPKHHADFQILESDEGESPTLTSAKVSKSSPTTPIETEGPGAAEGVGQGRVRAATAYTMVSYKKKIRNRSAGEKDELDEAPTHYFVPPPPSSPTTHPPLSPAKSPSSPIRSPPSHIPISKSPMSPNRSSPSHIPRRPPRSDYEEVDLPKKDGGHNAYEEVKLPSRIPTPRRQNPSPPK